MFNFFSNNECCEEDMWPIFTLSYCTLKSPQMKNLFNLGTNVVEFSQTKIFCVCFFFQHDVL